MPCYFHQQPVQQLGCSEWRSHGVWSIATNTWVPPYAVIVGVIESDGSQYQGRVGGRTSCSIITELGKIKFFAAVGWGKKTTLSMMK